MKPTADAQLQFLQHIQRLFEEGGFVATYKYALLMSLAELAVEAGETYEELPLPLIAIAEKFAEVYWPQTVPYISGAAGTLPAILSQNLGKQASVINGLADLRAQGASTIGQAKRLASWPQVVRKIAATVSDMPVQHLQHLGGTLVPFLYDYPHPRGAVVLKPGVAFMLRTLHPLIQQLSRAGWVRHVRENQRNADVIGHADELESFMFGAPRNTLDDVARLLSRLQSRKCFYCGHTISGPADVDHFIPWSKYPRDLAHNFVLAHPACNRQKSDMLAAERHLDHWLERNAREGDTLAGELPSFLADVSCSNRVAHWAYQQGVVTGAAGWIMKAQTEHITEGCVQAINACLR